MSPMPKSSIDLVHYMQVELAKRDQSTGVAILATGICILLS